MGLKHKKARTLEDKVLCKWQHIVEIYNLVHVFGMTCVMTCPMETLQMLATLSRWHWQSLSRMSMREFYRSHLSKGTQNTKFMAGSRLI